MRKINFAPEMLALVKSGVKTETRRTRKHGEVGDILETGEDLQLRLTEVYRERLQEITEESGLREGFICPGAFADYWDSLRCAAGKWGGRWTDNPLVWVHRFEVVRRES